MNEKTEVLLQQLEQGVKDVFTSERFINYLKFSAKFHRYSYNNVILIMAQKPDATMVAGFKKWNEMGRFVKKGEKGIAILAPSFKKAQEHKLDGNNNPIKDNEGKPVMIDKGKNPSGFFPTHVFDVSQTDGEPIPEIGGNYGGDVQDFELMWDALCTSSPYPVDFKENLGINGAKGVCCHTKQSIHILEGLSQEESVSTLIHEIAHARTYSPETKIGVDKNAREVEAESCAYVVSTYLGIDCQQSSFEYIASWCKSKEIKELKQSLNNINKEAYAIITSVTDHLNERQKEKTYAFER